MRTASEKRAVGSLWGPQPIGKVAICIAITAAATAALCLAYLPSGCTGSAGQIFLARQICKGKPEHQPLEFLRYEPSAWEQRWRDSAHDLQQQICPTIKKEGALVDRWMQAMPLALSGDMSAVENPDMADNDVWSHFVYRGVKNSELRVPIEPLVGLLRHPTSNADCARPDHPEYLQAVHDGKFVPIENKGYMLLQPLPREMLQTAYPGRRYLFDVGTGSYSSGSLPWFLEMYARQGIEFDEIFGWEVKFKQPEGYWEEWAPEHAYKMHFRNIPCSVDPDSVNNPLNIVRRLYKPGDFVAFKLDIDNEALEQALMSQLDANVSSMIASFFFEQHFDAPEMHRHFGVKLTTTYPETVELFHRHRAAGLRLHYWP